MHTVLATVQLFTKTDFELINGASLNKHGNPATNSSTEYKKVHSIEIQNYLSGK